jgi:hypothetical protein
VQRRGQQRFRRIVLAAYNGACAITGSKAEPVLEAAHIDPYSGDHTQHVTNGLLLRSDLHTLFDLHLITVTAGKLVAVSPRLRGTDYAAMNRQRLKLPGRVCASARRRRACAAPRPVSLAPRGVGWTPLMSRVTQIRSIVRRQSCPNPDGPLHQRRSCPQYLREHLKRSTTCPRGQRFNTQRTADSRNGGFGHQFCTGPSPARLGARFG